MNLFDSISNQLFNISEKLTDNEFKNLIETMSKLRPNIPIHKCEYINNIENSFDTKPCYEPGILYQGKYTCENHIKEFLQNDFDLLSYQFEIRHDELLKTYRCKCNERKAISYKYPCLECGEGIFNYDETLDEIKHTYPTYEMKCFDCNIDLYKNTVRIYDHICYCTKCINKKFRQNKLKEIHDIMFKFLNS